MTERKRQRVTGTEARTRKRKIQGQEFTEKDEIEHPTYDVPEQYARVRVGGGVTQSVGADTYNFVRVDVVIERPCPNTDADIEDTYKSVSDAVDDYLRKELEYALGDEG